MCTGENNARWQQLLDLEREYLVRVESEVSAFVVRGMEEVKRLLQDCTEVGIDCQLWGRAREIAIERLRERGVRARVTVDTNGTMVDRGAQITMWLRRVGPDPQSGPLPASGTAGGGFHKTV